MTNFDTIRSAEQICDDLAKAFGFSVADLPAYRDGALPGQARQFLLGKVVKPLLISAALTLLPLFIAAYLTSSSHSCSLSEGLLIVLSMVGHIRDLAETDGWFRAILYFAGGLALLGLAVYYATRIPAALLADLIAKRVRSVEGRVSAREEEKHVRGKRDEVTVYHFDMKVRTFDVSRRAFQALDSGGAYRVYYLPRSQTLVAVEPSVIAREAEEKARKRSATPVVPDLI